MQNRSHTAWLLLVLMLVTMLCSVTSSAEEISNEPVPGETPSPEEPAPPAEPPAPEELVPPAEPPAPEEPLPPAETSAPEETVPAETAAPEEPAETTAPEESFELTPEGNLTLIDDYTLISGDGSCQKQFITVQSKAGNYFYIIIDRNSEDCNVHFLNKVDEADLMALTEEENGKKPDVCICTEKCSPGHVNMDCPVCSKDISRCAGEEPAATEAPTEEPAASTEDKKGGSSMPLIILGVVLVAGIGAAAFLKFRKKKPAPDIDEDAFDDYSADPRDVSNHEIDLPSENEDDERKEG